MRPTVSDSRIWQWHHAGPCALLLAAVLSMGLADRVDPRTKVWVDLTCESEIATRQITLFANGTVRLREKSPDEDRVQVAELGPDELTALREKIESEDLSETYEDWPTVEGSWVPVCKLSLEFEREEPAVYRFGRYDSLSLALSRIVRSMEELGNRAESTGFESRLPSGYEPKPGDILMRHDAVEFEVIGLDPIAGGVELQGVTVPLTMYVARGALPLEFVALVSRRDR